MPRRTLNVVAVAALAAAALFLWRPWADPAARRSPGVSEANTPAASDPGTTRDRRADPTAKTPKRTVPDAGRGSRGLAPAPPDRVETGACTLRIQLRDVDTGAFLRGRILLWRLNAPGNEDYTAGDQFQRLARVPKEGAVLTGLAAGRYRAICRDAVAGSEAPEAFDVAGPETSVILPTRTARTYPIYLKLYGPDGTQVERCWYGGRSTAVRRRPEPPWKTKVRTLVHPDRYAPVRPFSTGEVGTGHYERTVRAPFSQQRLTLGHAPQDSIGTRYETIRYAFPESGRNSGWVTVRLDVPARVEGDLHYVGRTAREARIRDSVTLPDGRPPIKARFQIECPAALVRGGKTPEWRMLPIHVRVTLRGYEELSFEVSPRDPLEPRVLRPLEEDG